MSEKMISQKHCANGEIYNEKTKRCIKDTPANRRRLGLNPSKGKSPKDKSPEKTCKDGEIYNEKPKRCIKDTPVNRRRAGLNPPKSKSPNGKSPNGKFSEKKCKDGEIYNEKTKRCIKDTLANRRRLGLNSPSKSSKSKSPKSSSNTSHKIPRNNFKPSKEIISGITNIKYYLNDNLDMQVLLFSDIHDSENRCEKHNIPSESYIDGFQYFKEILDYNEAKSDEILDIFFEYGPIGHEKISFNPSDKISEKVHRRERELQLRSNIELGKTIKFMHKCLNVEKYEYVGDKTCEYQYIRAHYTDFRKNFYFNENYMNVYLKLFKLKPKYQHYVDNLEKLYDNSENFIDELLSIPKMKRQYDNIDNEHLKDTIINFFKNRVLMYKENRIQSMEGKTGAWKMIPLVEFMMSYYALIMDLYLMGRLFRKFDVNPDPKRTSRKRHSDKVHKSIIYAGYSHCEVYGNLLEHLGFEKIYETGVDKEQKCLSVKGLELGF